MTMPLDFIFGRQQPAAAPMQTPIINIPAPVTMDDPRIEQARLASLAARARAQGRGDTMFTDMATESKMPPLLKPTLGA